MRIGKYQHRLQIQEPVLIQDQITGAPVTAWTTIGEVWASIEPVNVRSTELELGDMIVGETYSYICMRWSGFTARITPTHRGTHQGTVFNFLNVAHVKLAQREIKLLATSGVNDG